MFYLNNHIAQLDLQATLAAVSEQRRLHALRYRQEHDQRLSLAAYQLLQRALSLEYGIVEPPLFTFEAHGKPRLVGHPDIHFNLTHCHEAAACVVSSVPVGIDVESLSSYDAEMVKTVMNDDEQQFIASSSDPSLAFIRLWTMKESFLKMTGEGVVADMRQVFNALPQEKTGGGFSVHNAQFQTVVFPQFVCTVCH